MEPMYTTSRYWLGLASTFIRFPSIGRRCRFEGGLVISMRYTIGRLSFWSRERCFRTRSSLFLNKSARKEVARKYSNALGLRVILVDSLVSVSFTQVATNRQILSDDRWGAQLVFHKPYSYSSTHFARVGQLWLIVFLQIICTTDDSKLRVTLSHLRARHTSKDPSGTRIRIVYRAL